MCERGRGAEAADATVGFQQRRPSVLPTGRLRSRPWQGPGGRPLLPSPSAPRPQSSAAPGRRRRRARSRYSVTGGANGCRHPRVFHTDALEGPPPPWRGCHRPATKPDSVCTDTSAPVAPALAAHQLLPQPSGAGPPTPRARLHPDPAPVTLSCPSDHPSWGRREATPGQVTPWLLSPAAAAGHQRLLRTLLAAVASPCESLTFPFRPRAPFTAVGRHRALW